jgi:branched-chain amino acid transport system substrate-binding protein
MRVRASLLAAIALLAASASIPAGPAHAEVRIGAAGPITGNNDWFGEQMLRGVEAAVEDLNTRGGVLGQQVRVVAVDDACNAEQGAAAARKLIADGVVFVSGHVCSGAAIPASAVYEAHDVLDIAPTATNPRLTEQGFSRIFRLVGRDDQQGEFAAGFTIDRWPGKRVALVHDSEAYGKGLVEQVKRALNVRGVQEVALESVRPGQVDFGPLLSRLAEVGAEIVYYGGYSPEAGLLVRQGRTAGHAFQLVTGDSLYTEQFGLIAGEAAEGAIFSSYPDPRRNPEAAEVVARFRAAGFEPEGLTLYHYASVQVWAQAAEKAGSLSGGELAAILRRERFPTVLGLVEFDTKGDVTGVTGFAWYVWRGGKHVPLDEPRTK